MTGKKCVIRVKNEKELKSIQEKHPMVVKAFLSDKCGHCASIKPVLEEQCKITRDIMPFEVVPTIHCPVEKEFCRDELKKLLVDDYKEQNGITDRDLTKKEFKKIFFGVPYIVGRDKDGSKHFTIAGGGEKGESQVKGYYSVLQKLIENTKKTWVERNG